MRERLDRSAVVHAAAEIADSLGDINRLTLAEVAGHFKVKLPSLYNHVDGLAGLRREIALLGVRQLTEGIQSAAVGRSGDEALVAIAHAYRDFARKYPGRYAASLEAPDPNDEELTKAAQKLLALLMRVLEFYRLSEMDTVHVLRGFRSALHGFVALETLGGFKMAVDLDESFDRLIQMFLSGLRK